MCLKFIHSRIFLFFSRLLKQNCLNVFVFLRRTEQSFRFSLETDNWRMKLTFLIFYLANKFQQAKPQGAESILEFYSELSSFSQGSTFCLVSSPYSLLTLHNFCLSLSAQFYLLGRPKRFNQFLKQALRSSCKFCKLLELHASSWNCMQAHGTACNLMVLHASSWNYMQAHGSACKPM